jgi:hypothetical protein
VLYNNLHPHKHCFYCCCTCYPCCHVLLAPGLFFPELAKLSAEFQPMFLLLLLLLLLLPFAAAAAAAARSVLPRAGQADC